TTPGFDPERPFGAAGPGAFAEMLERHRCLAHRSDSDAGLHQLDQCWPVHERLLVLARFLGGRERLVVLTVAVVDERAKAPRPAKRRALPSRARVLKREVGERLPSGPITLRSDELGGGVF